MFEPDKATRWRKTSLHGFVVNFGTSVTLPGMWARLRPQGAVTWLLNGGVRVCGAEESYAKLPIKVFCCVGRIIPVGRNHFRSFLVTGLRGDGTQRRSLGGWLCLRAGACGSRASEELLFTCARIVPADTDGCFAGSRGRVPTAVRRWLPEQSGSGELPRCARHTPHLTWGHGRWREGRRIQTEDTYLQKR